MLTLQQNPDKCSSMEFKASCIIEKILLCAIAVLDSKEHIVNDENELIIEEAAELKDGQQDLVDEFEKISKQLTVAEVQLFVLFKELEAKPKKLSKSIEVIRRLLGRMHVIQATSYIPSCYTLMDVMVLTVFTLMAITDWPMHSQYEIAMGFTVIISFLFSFLWLMVRTLEDPFQYPHNYNLNCYKDGKRPELKLAEEFVSIGSIDMSGLTVEYGTWLKEALKKRDETTPQQAGEKNQPHALGTDANLVVSAEEKRAALVRRWTLFVYTLPAIACMVGFRFAVWFGGSTGGWLPPQIFSSFISLTVFVTALLLQGLIQDYKESERMPSELLNAFQSLCAAVGSALKLKEIDDAASANKETDEAKRKKLQDGTKRMELYASSLQNIEEMLLAILSVVDSTDEEPELVSETFSVATKLIREAEKQLMLNFVEGKSFDLIPSILKPLGTVRTLCARIHIIKKTSYILASYALVDKMTVTVFVLMTLSDWPYATMHATALAYTVVITFLFVYLAGLIRRIEDPFAYPSSRPKGLHPHLTDAAGGGISRIAARGFNVECYLHCSDSEWVRRARVATGGNGSIDMSVVCVGFGKQLRRMMAHPSAPPPVPTPAADLSQREEPAPLAKGSGPAYLLKRWRLALQAAPFVLVLLGCRFAVWYGGGVGGWVDPAVFTSFIGVVIFVGVVLMQGIIQDFKEAEKMPSELFSALQGLTAALQARWHASCDSILDLAICLSLSNFLAMIYLCLSFIYLYFYLSAFIDRSLYLSLCCGLRADALRGPHSGIGVLCV